MRKNLEKQKQFWDSAVPFHLHFKFYSFYSLFDWLNRSHLNVPNKIQCETLNN